MDNKENAGAVKVAEAFARAAGLPVSSEIAVAALADNGAGRPALVFDASKYLGFLEGSDLTDAQSKELLESLWVIVVGFVDLGFGASPIQQAMDKSQVVEGTATRVVVSSTGRHSDTNNRTDEARSHRAPREMGIHEPH